MNRIAKEISEDGGNVVPLKYQYLLSNKVRELLAEKDLIVEVEEQTTPYTIWQPFSFAGLPEFFPTTNHDYGQDCDGNTVDRHNIENNDIGKNISETVNNFFTRTGLDTTDIHWWPVYTYTQNVANVSRVFFTANSNNTPLSGTKFAGFAFRTKEKTSFTEDLSHKEWNEHQLSVLENALIPVEAWTNGDLISITLKYKDRNLAVAPYCDKSVEFFDYKIISMISSSNARYRELKILENANFD